MTETPVETVKALYAAFGRRDVQAIFARLAPDVVLRQSSRLPWGGEYRGLDGARQFLQRLTSHLESAVEIERYVDGGEHVAAIGTSRGTTRTTGRPFRVPVVHVWSLRDGRVTAVVFCIDDAAMLAALDG